MSWRPDRFEFWTWARLEPVLQAVVRRRDRARERLAALVTGLPGNLALDEAEPHVRVTAEGWRQLEGHYARAHASLREAMEHVRLATELLETMRREGRAPYPADDRRRKLH